MKCDQCGAVFEQAKFCPECGARVAQPARCESCGTVHSGKFCPECGRATASTAVREPAAEVLTMEPVELTPRQESRVQAGSQSQTLQYPGMVVEKHGGAQPIIVIKNENIVANVNENTNAPKVENNVVNMAGQPGYYQSPPPGYSAYPSPKSRTAALVLCAVLGVLGVHQFYAGKVGMGLLYLFTGGLFAIGWLVDIILIATGQFRDRYGYRIENW